MCQNESLKYLNITKLVIYFVDLRSYIIYIRNKEVQKHRGNQATQEDYGTRNVGEDNNMYKLHIVRLNLWSTMAAFHFDVPEPRLC